MTSRKETEIKKEKKLISESNLLSFLTLDNVSSE